MKLKNIFVFPGQGAQYIGMGQDVYRDWPVARYVFECVSDIVHRDISKICFKGPADKLNTPENASLGTLAHSVAIVRVIEAEFQQPLYDIGYAVVGHSMGQYSALCSADSISLPDAVRLVSARSLYMSMAHGAAGMIAVVGLNRDQVENLLFLAVGRGFAAISNHNASDQFIISGEDVALEAIMAGALKSGARMVRRLNVGIPAHCALMMPAAVKMKHYMDTIKIKEPKTNWFSNQTASMMHQANDVRDSLLEQMTNGVRWCEIMEKFPIYNIKHAYEIGPGKTLSRLINRAGISCKALHTDNSINVRHIIDSVALDLRGGR